MIRILQVVAVAAAAVAVSPALTVSASYAAPGYEGMWSVEVIPETGTCDGPYVLPIEVVQYRIRYVGKGQLAAEGGITPDGNVRVSFVSEGDSLNAKGRLSSPRFGNGSWVSPTEDCGGTWIARKR